MKTDGRDFICGQRYYVESEPFFNRQIGIHLGSDFRYNVSPRTRFMEGAFVNKIIHSNSENQRS